ncbi:MAG: hypothetical protein V7776_05085 [Halopseudomonas aestusnigri]
MKAYSRFGDNYLDENLEIVIKDIQSRKKIKHDVDLIDCVIASLAFISANPLIFVNAEGKVKLRNDIDELARSFAEFESGYVSKIKIRRQELGSAQVEFLLKQKNLVDLNALLEASSRGKNTPVLFIDFLRTLFSTDLFSLNSAKNNNAKKIAAIVDLMRDSDFFSNIETLDYPDYVSVETGTSFEEGDVKGNYSVTREAEFIGPPIIVTGTGSTSSPVVVYQSKEEATEALSEVIDVLKSQRVNSIGADIEKLEAIFLTLQNVDESDDEVIKDLARKILKIVLRLLEKKGSAIVNLAIAAIVTVSISLLAGAGDVGMSAFFSSSLLALTNPKKLKATIKKALADDDD